MSDRTIRPQGAEIPEKVLRRIWEQKFGDKPFPSVVGLVLKRKEFIKNAMRLESNSSALHTGVLEYGRIVDLKEAGACVLVYRYPVVYYGKPRTYVILLAEDCLDKGQELLEHELRHIYSRDYHEFMEEGGTTK